MSSEESGRCDSIAHSTKYQRHLQSNPLGFLFSGKYIFLKSTLKINKNVYFCRKNQIC